MRLTHWMSGVLAMTLSGALGCGGSAPNVTRDGVKPDITQLDAGASVDAGDPPDTGVVVDAGDPVDAGTPVDAGDPADAGVIIDAGDPADAGIEVDAGDPADVGVEVDAGDPIDAGTPVDPPDAGVEADAGDPVDAGMPDDPPDAGGVADAGDPISIGDPTDAGPPVDPPDAGIEVDAGTPVDSPDAGVEVDAGTPVDPPDAGGVVDAGDPIDAGTPVDPPDAGAPPDAGGPPDAGNPPDAGDPPDAGTGVDAGTPDAGPAHLTVNLPNIPDWTFYGPQHGGPDEVYGASFDEGGNLWVAGGEEGLFVMRAGTTTYQQFTMADGLRPYGYMFDGSEPPGGKYLKVISVSGGPAGVAFVGYAGKPSASGDELACEDNWDSSNPDPAIYKSGDADKVTLTPTGISAVHYDISSGLGIVGGELRGREKICSVLRIRYDKVNNKVWFGGNHGIAMGDANYQGTAKCKWYATTTPTVPKSKTDPYSNEAGHFGCSGVLEHAHPAVNGYKSDGVTCCSTLSGGYYGVALDPLSHDVWFGGQMRTTRFRYASSGGNFYTAQSKTEDSQYISNRIDIWPDLVQEPNYPKPSDRLDDFVSGTAFLPDGSFWVSSFVRGLAHLNANGTVLERLTTTDGLATNKLYSLVVDPLDSSVWAGTSYAGISRLQNGMFTQYGYAVFGDDLTNGRIMDLQAFGTGATRRIVVSFGGSEKRAGAVGIYTGQ